MRNGWTGGQYSVYRAMLGAFLVCRFGRLLSKQALGLLGGLPGEPLFAGFPNVLALDPGPVLGGILLAVALAASVALAFGFHDRIAAPVALYLGACLLGRQSGSGYWLEAVLLLHTLAPALPFGSWRARGRPDPDGGWKLPGWLYAAVWALLALGYFRAGLDHLRPAWLSGDELSRAIRDHGALRLQLTHLPEATWWVVARVVCVAQLVFVPWILFHPTRRWAWSVSALGQLAGWALFGWTPGAGIVLVHVLAFDPAWMRSLAASARETIFYDGTCGLCHTSVRFVLAEDAAGRAFRFAPLGGEAFRAAVPEEVRACLPDSMVLRRADGGLLMRSRAVLHLGARLGGLWRVAATAARVVPPSVLDSLYDLLAAARHRLFGRTDDACPIVPAELRERFEL